MTTPDDVQQRLAAEEARFIDQLAVIFRLQGDAAVRQLDLFAALFDELPSPEQAGALLDQALIEQMGEAVQDAATTSYSYGAADMSAELRLGIAFDVEHPRAVDFLRGYGARQVQLISETSRSEIARVLATAADEGWSYQRLGRQIRTLHSEWSATRAQTIAITELGNAYQQANLDAVRDAGSLGLHFEKRWSNTGDSQVSDQCRADTAAGWIDLETAFPSGNMRPLGHVRCRCAAQFRRKR